MTFFLKMNVKSVKTYLPLILTDLPRIPLIDGPSNNWSNEKSPYQGNTETLYVLKCHNGAHHGNVL
jgi:hypothetical protein